MNQLLRLATIRSTDDAVSPDSRLEAAETLRPSDDTCQSPVGPRILEIDTLVSARGLVKSYRKGKHEVPVLAGVDFSVQAGEFVAIVGQSGSGKSTLLHLLGTLDAPDCGEIFFEGNRIDNLPATARDLLRNQYFGMIFQFYHLLPELTALENVLVPQMIARGSSATGSTVAAMCIRRLNCSTWSA